MSISYLIQKIRDLLKNPSLFQSLILVAGTTLAYGLDYLFNLAAGRLLTPADFGVLAALAGTGQVLVVASRVVQTVVTRYISDFQADPQAQARAISFFRRMFRATSLWGGLATLLLILFSFPYARFLRVDTVAPVVALMGTAFLMATRPVVGGTLQGLQRFAALGNVQIVQAVLRLAVGGVLMWWGWGVFGAMVSLPIASGLTLLFGLWLLGGAFWRKPIRYVHHDVSLPALFRYSLYTGAGLIGFALLANMDAILAKRFFTDVDAGNYAAAITLGKVVQFFPLAIIMILFPKVARRRAENRDSAGILLPAMFIVGVLCGGIALLYYLFPDFLIGVTLGDAYDVSGSLLGLIGVAMALLSLANVWLNYFLSLDITRYVYLVWVATILQAILMWQFHSELWHLPAIAAGNGFWLFIAGILIYHQERQR